MEAKKPLILCVDDDPDILLFLETVLEAEGYEVACAGSAEEAERMYRDRRPDALIVDMMMEEVDAGTALVKDLQAEGNRSPVFMLSSVGDSLSYTVQEEALGLAGIFQKPLQKGPFLSVLRMKLEQAGSKA